MNTNGQESESEKDLKQSPFDSTICYRSEIDVRNNVTETFPFLSVRRM